MLEIGDLVYVGEFPFMHIGDGKLQSLTVCDYVFIPNEYAQIDDNSDTLDLGFNSDSRIFWAYGGNATDVAYALTILEDSQF